MAKGKRPGRPAKKRGRRKATKEREIPLGPRRLSNEEQRAAAVKREEELQTEFERRKRAQIAKAAIELDHVDAEILRLLLTYPSMTQEQIGDVIGLSRSAISERVNAEKFKRAIEIANRSALEVFEGNKARAARVLGELLASPDDRIKIRAAIAHMWPEIHQQDKSGGASDFVAFIQEAYELANETKSGASSESAKPEVGGLDQTKKA
jgi:predicted DNA-binding protein (UPF0251 family)